MSAALAKLGQWFAFNSAGRAGPRRLVIIALAAIGIVGVVIGASMLGHRAPVVSRDARMKPVDSLPGGLHSDAEQNKLALKTDQEQANAALAGGRSFTPQMAPSEGVRLPPQMAETPPPPAPAQHALRFASRPAPVIRPVEYTPPAPSMPAAMPSVADQRADQNYDTQLNNLFSQWGARAPHTDVILPPIEPPAAPASDAASSGTATNTARVSTASAPVDGPATPEAQQVLVPAGRGVFAHTVLAVNSDASNPVVLQADSGPIAGDRMIGEFSRENDRLIVRVSSIVHDGQTIGVDGVAIAPDTMEAAVASSVDEHYMMRFVLPAAAAFVQGLGQALATTSNTVGVLSPLGGASYITKLSLPQQMGVAAGVAAGQVGNALNQAAPKGPTVRLDANVTIGVMFLANVVAKE